MKFVFAIALLFASLAVKSQSVVYSVECPKPDSCFLKEVSTGASTTQEPRPQAITSWRFFRTLEEYDAIVSDIRKQAAEELKNGMEQVDKARGMNAVADKIDAVRPKQKK